MILPYILQLKSNEVHLYLCRHVSPNQVKLLVACVFFYLLHPYSLVLIFFLIMYLVESLHTPNLMYITKCYLCTTYVMMLLRLNLQLWNPATTIKAPLEIFTAPPSAVYTCTQLHQGYLMKLCYFFDPEHVYTT